MAGTNVDLHQASGLLKVEILRAQELIAKDTGMFRSNKSDPYCKLFVDGKFAGRTKTVKRSLTPTWNESITVRMPPKSRKVLTIDLFDADELTNDDPIGRARIDVVGWYTETGLSRSLGIRLEKQLPVEACHGCSDASGTIDVAITFEPTSVAMLGKGSIFEACERSQQIIALGWTGAFGAQVDLDASCIFFDERGMAVDALFFGKSSCFGGAATHSGDARTGEEVAAGGADERIVLSLSALPPQVRAILVIVTAYAEKSSFSDVSAAFCGLWDPEMGEMCRFELNPSGPHTALVMCRLARATQPGSWLMSAIGDVAVGPRDYGSWLPELKGYLRDIIPHVRVGDPQDRIAVMRKGRKINLADYASTPLRTVAAGLSWDVTKGCAIDLDASAIMLDERLKVIEIVSFSHQVSRDGTVRHSGDDRSGKGGGDDEIIYVDLEKLNPVCKYLAFIVCSYSGQRFNNVDNASCHLFVPIKANQEQLLRQDELATFSLAGHSYHCTAILMAILTAQHDQTGQRAKGWYMCACGAGFHGRVAKDCIDETQEFIRTGNIIRN